MKTNSQIEEKILDLISDAKQLEYDLDSGSLYISDEDKIKMSIDLNTTKCKAIALGWVVGRNDL